MLRILFITVLAGTVLLNLAYMDQPLLGAHAFRQTQTALTVFWFVEEGIRLAYQTPVVGYPWEIPFEFPLYQALVALLAKYSALGLDSAGRLVSYLFLVGSLVPLRATLRRLLVREEVFWISAVLFLSNPLYLHWGRAFLIETAALFFTLAALPFFIDLLQQRRTARAVTLFSLFMTLAMLQKVTTPLPVLLVLGSLYAYALLRQHGVKGALLALGPLLAGAVAFLLPLMVAVWWTHYTDQVKMLNPVGQELTSAALAQWNWGELSQRLDARVYATIYVERILGGLPMAAVVVPLLLVALLRPSPKLDRRLLLLLLAMALLPVLLFINLHHQHVYYQVSIALFLLVAVAYALVHDGLQQVANGRAIVLLTLAMVLLNILHFTQSYGTHLATRQASVGHPVLAMSRLLRDNLPEDYAFIGFGLDWNSALAYYSRRKALMVPGWLPDQHRVWRRPEQFLGSTPLGALVDCRPPEQRATSDYALLFKGRLRPAGYQVGGCYLLFNADLPPPTS